LTPPKHLHNNRIINPIERVGTKPILID
jgi:hypothetical protein